MNQSYYEFCFYIINTSIAYGYINIYYNIMVILIITYGYINIIITSFLLLWLLFYFKKSALVPPRVKLR